MTSLQPADAAAVASEHDESLVRIIDLIRTREACTRPELGRSSGLGRSIVTQRVEQAIELGLVTEADRGPSTGGRAPRLLRFRAERGIFLAVVFGALNVGAAVADLDGTMLLKCHEAWDISAGPEESLAHVSDVLEGLRTQLTGHEVWGVAVGVPGPVEFSSGRPVAPPIMPGWNGFDIRSWLEKRFQAPVWVDNDVNLMALGALRRQPADGPADLLFVKVGSGIGAGLISGGRLHRGATGAAGDVGHIIVTNSPGTVCRCGQLGCLEAVAGGWALARDGEAQARAGGSPFLRERLDQGHSIVPADIADGARIGDPACVELIARSGRIVGENVASMVSFFNPSVVTVGGSIGTTGDSFLAAVRQVVYQRSLPLATRDLRIIASPDHEEGLVGAAWLAGEQVLGRQRMERWIERGSPLEVPRSNLYRLSG